MLCTHIRNFLKTSKDRTLLFCVWPVFIFIYGIYVKIIPNTLAFGPIFPGDEVLEYNPDEFIEISRPVENCKIIAAAMYELSK